MKALAPALLALLVFAACNSAGTPVPAEIIIASDLPESGFNADAAIAEQAISFAIAQQGSIDGFKLGYLSLDDSLGALASAPKGIENVRRIIGARPVLGMIGPYNSSVAVYEIPIANQASLAMVSPATTRTCLTLSFPYCGIQPKELRPHTNNFFRLAAPDSLQGRGMARYVNEALKLKRVAVFNENFGPGGDQIIKEFASEFARSGGQVVLRGTVAPSETPNFTKFLDDAKVLEAQAVYAVGDSSGHICAALAQMTVRLPGAYFLGTDGIAGDDRCLEDAGAANVDGIVATFVDVDSRKSTDPAVTAYLRAYPKPSDISIYTFAAIDCARLLIDAIKRAIVIDHGSLPTRADVVAQLAATQGFKGVTGTYSFTENGDALSPMMSIHQVKNGKWGYLEQIDVSTHS
jgi:branched-chain amino acid transport system substrate-binding protein